MRTKHLIACFIFPDRQLGLLQMLFSYYHMRHFKYSICRFPNPGVAGFYELSLPRLLRKNKSYSIVTAES